MEIIDSAGTSTSEPLADGSFGNTEGGCDIALLPTLLVKIPCSEPALLVPIQLPSLFLCHWITSEAKIQGFRLL